MNREENLKWLWHCSGKPSFDIFWNLVNVMFWYWNIWSSLMLVQFIKQNWYYRPSEACWPGDLGQMFTSEELSQKWRFLLQSHCILNPSKRSSPEGSHSTPSLQRAPQRNVIDHLPSWPGPWLVFYLCSVANKQYC